MVKRSANPYERAGERRSIPSTSRKRIRRKKADITTAPTHSSHGDSAPSVSSPGDIRREDAQNGGEKIKTQAAVHNNSATHPAVAKKEKAREKKIAEVGDSIKRQNNKLSNATITAQLESTHRRDDAKLKIVLSRIGDDYFRSRIPTPDNPDGLSKFEEDFKAIEDPVQKINIQIKLLEYHTARMKAMDMTADITSQQRTIEDDLRALSGI